MLAIMNLPSTSHSSEPSTTTTTTSSSSDSASASKDHAVVIECVTSTARPSTSSPTESLTVPTSPPPPPSVVMVQAPSTTVASSVDYAGPHDSPDTKEGIEELCPVCGDKVSGYHYGLLTCESCKGFFKRTVQNKKVYTCVADRNCHIDKSQRKRCPFCRFQKCLDVGMKLEAVRADRMRGGRNKFGPMYKRDRARKLQAIRQQQLTVRGGTTCQIGGAGQNDSLYSVYQPQSTTPIVTSSGATGNRLFDPSVPHIKQELIQIPQLSSSTSSPDSSPSPLTTLGSHHHPNSNNNNNNNQQQQQQQQQQSITIVASPQHQQHGDSKQSVWPPHHAPQPHAHQQHQQPGQPPHAPTSPHDPKSYPYDSLTAPSHGGQSGPIPLVAPSADDRVPAVIREFQQTTMDDKEWQNQLFGLLQNQTYNQCEVDLFELMCKVIDQGLFAQVDWARNSIFFKDLKVDDQMKLLQHSWSDILMLDHIHQRLHSNLPDEMILPNGQKFDLLALALLGLPSMSDQLNKLTLKLQELKFDEIDFICLKFLLLLNQDSLANPDIRGLTNRKLVQEAQERVQRALHEYCVNCYPQINDKFGQMMALMPDLHVLSSRGEEYLYCKHINGNAPTQTLLMEMLHAKRK